MKCNMLASGLFLFSMSAFANQNLTLGSDDTYTVDGMKERCRQFQKASEETGQVKPFNIRIECNKTENRWELLPQKRPLPMWVKFSAEGTGKGKIQGGEFSQSLSPTDVECLAYQEKTVLFTASVELSCDQFVNQVTSLERLCSEGLVSQDGSKVAINWQQAGEAETGSQFTSGCKSEIKGANPAQGKEGISQQTPSQEQPGQAEPAQQQPGQQQPGQAQTY